MTRHSQNLRSARRIAAIRDALLLVLLRPGRLAGAGWARLCGKRLRARNRLHAAIASLPFAHQRRMQAAALDDFGVLSEVEDEALPGLAVHLHLQPGDRPEQIRRALASARRQSLAARRILVTAAEGAPTDPLDGAVELVAGRFPDRLSGLGAALDAAHGLGIELLVPLAACDALPGDALAAYAAATTASGVPCLLYGDQDEFGPGGGHGRDPWLKPQWDPRLFLSQDYIGHACALPVDAVRADLAAVPPCARETLYERLLRLTFDPAGPALAVGHVPRVTARTPVGAWQRDQESRRAVVGRLLDGRAAVRAGQYGAVAVEWNLPSPLPRVSIVVATRDRVELLRTCMEGLLEDTDYPNFDIVLVDNDSRDAETLDYMDRIAANPRVQLLRWPHPFNYSAINNHGARHASGEFLCLLNNDVEIVHPDWLTAMVREAVQPGVGAVGARLLYPDRSIQHAGVVIGMGNAAGHAHRGLAEGEAGYFAQAHVARGASAVTAACLLVAKADFDAVGGLDEAGLAVAYNDVDLCLKLRARGLANIYTPAATLVHHESKSRGLDFAPEHMERYLRELAVFQQRWDSVTHVDAWHHPHLDRASETYVAGFPH